MQKKIFNAKKLQKFNLVIIIVNVVDVDIN